MHIIIIKQIWLISFLMILHRLSYRCSMLCDLPSFIQYFQVVTTLPKEAEEYLIGLENENKQLKDEKKYLLSR